MTAQAIVRALLETDYDAHVKAHQRIQTWDKALGSAKELLGLKQKSLATFRELGVAMGYERALARVGLRREDVAHQIRGSQIGSTHNYKKTVPVRRCANIHCNDRRPKPESQEACLNCGEPLQTKPVPLSFTDLHNKFGKHILGVETHDGRRVWFDDPLSPNFEADDPQESVAPKARPNRPYWKNFDITKE